MRSLGFSRGAASACAAAALFLWGAAALAAEEPAPEAVVYRVFGLFSPDRVEDLKETMEETPEVELRSVDYDKAEAVFVFDAKRAFPGAKPQDVLKRFDERLRNVSRGTFGVRSVCELPRESLQRVEIPVRGLDCKGCCLAAYESVCKLDGVEQATASFKDGLVVAWLDPKKADRAKLEGALKQKGVELPPPAEEKK